MNNNIIDINIDGVQKSKFRINGDNDSIIELNTSDMNIYDRLQEGYSRLQKSVKDIMGLDIDEETLSPTLKKIDKEMRDAVDYIFDSNVSDVCCKGGTMIDPIDGGYRFEKIIDSLTKLYADNLNSEYNKMRNRVNAAAKVPQDHKPKANKKKRIVENETPLIESNE